MKKNTPDAIAQNIKKYRLLNNMTQEELAQLVGASRETVNKALAEFVSRGWIRLEARAVVILDLQRLRQRSR